MKYEYKELVVPKVINMSRKGTIKTFKEKIIRCINYMLNKNHQVNTDTHDIKIIFPELQNKKKEIFEIIYAYTNNYDNYILEGKNIEEQESLLIQVQMI